MNVIVIVADSLRFDYLGCYGNKWIKTPNIDEFAEQSIVFENAYAEGLPTIPVRKALFTGRYTLPFSGWEPLNSSDIILSEILYWEGIRSALITDTLPMHMPRFGYERGFDFVKYIRGGEFDPFYSKIPLKIDLEQFHKPKYEKKGKRMKEDSNSLLARRALDYHLRESQNWKSDADHAVAQVCKTAMNYLEKFNKKDNIFFWLDSFDPHEPWDPPSVYNPEMKCPYDLDYNGKDIISPVSTYVDGYLTEEENNHIRMLYAEKITMVDKWIGKFLDKLKELEMFDDSLIIFLSDHGEPLGNMEHGHGIITKCRPWPYEELAHIPLIIYHPEAHPQRCSTFVETVDIAPTILEFLNIKRMQGKMQGKTLIPLILGQTEKVKDFAIAGYYNFSWSIQTEDWSYIHWIEKKEPEIQKLVGMYGVTKWENTDIWKSSPEAVSEITKTDELYDRKKDQFQLNNLADQEPDIAKELYQQLRNYMFDLKKS